MSVTFLRFITGVAKPLPEGKKVPAKTFSSTLWNFLKNLICYAVLIILQYLIEKYRAGIAIDIQTAVKAIKLKRE